MEYFSYYITNKWENLNELIRLIHIELGNNNSLITCGILIKNIPGQQLKIQNHSFFADP